LRLAEECTAQFLLCSACLERVVGILRRVFQVIFNIIGKKVMSEEEIIQFTKEFLIPRDRRAADFKDKKDKKWDCFDLMDPFPSTFHPETKKCLHQDSVA
jgi:hypothetical protein